MLIIFGAGIRGKTYLDVLKSQEINVDFFCDNNEKLWGQRVYDTPVISLVELKEKYRNADILIANKKNKALIREQLRNMGIINIRELEEIIFFNKRITDIDEMRDTSIYTIVEKPILSIIVIGKVVGEKILDSTWQGILAQELTISYEVVSWNGYNTIIKGKKILFLTNGSMIQKDSVRALVDLEEKNMCVIGSKTINQNGIINQAGYVFTDKNRLEAYGWRNKAYEPEYEYVRECDVISLNGLLTDVSNLEIILRCIATEVNLEEVAVSFALWCRKKNKKLLFQPFSLILEKKEIPKEYVIESKILMEESSKYFLQINKEKNLFWKANGADASCYMLMVDHGIAKFDTNAGDRTVYGYIQILLELNVRMIYLLNNFCYDYRYVRIFQEKGIFVVYGERWEVNYKTLLLQLFSKIEYVFLNRPNIANRYIDFIRENSNAMIVYYGHDLHCLRLQREYSLTGEENVLKEAEKYRNIEYSLIEKADIIGYPSVIEVEELKREFPDSNIQMFPMAFFEDIPYERRNEKKEGILFVGGYVHKPNEDAAVWLVKEILPELRSKGIRDKVYLVGSNPTNKILELKDEDVIVTGYVSEEELQKLYEKCFVCVFPLRYGAGIKGKVLEALYQGIPVVTTFVGAEGLGAAESVLEIGNSAGEIVQKVEMIYKNADKMCERGKERHEYITQRFSKKAIKELFESQIKQSKERVKGNV